MALFLWVGCSVGGVGFLWSGEGLHRWWRVGCRCCAGGDEIAVCHMSALYMQLIYCWILPSACCAARHLVLVEKRMNCRIVAGRGGPNGWRKDMMGAVVAMLEYQYVRAW